MRTNERQTGFRSAGLSALSAVGLALALTTCNRSAGHGPGDLPPTPGTGDSPSAPGTEDVTLRRSALATRPATPPPSRTSTAAVGYTPGTGWVGHDGAYHYRIPIEVPPGRAGMAPSLAISYSSRDGNGPVGVGFSLEGASSITRCDKVVASGGMRDRVKFKTFDDGYCLDGQRLVFISGTAGEVGAHYRPELESFTRVRIAAKSGNQTITKWTAETKDGRTLTYEVLAETVGTSGTEPWTQRQLVNANGTANGTPATVQLVWPLTKQVDRSGNGMRYSYVRSSGPSNDGGGDTPLLQQIDYTTCETTPCDFADTARPRRVFLDYEARPADDRLERWVNGVVVRTNVRLRNIRTLIQADGGQWTPQRDYVLSYWQDQLDPANGRVTKRSLVQSVQVCEGLPFGGPTRTCLFPTNFDWQSRAGYKVRSTGVENGFDYRSFVGKTTKMELMVYDANGDGNDDVVLHEPNQVAGSSDGAFTAATTYKERVLLADGGGQFRSAVDVDWSAGACKSLTHLGMSLPVDLDGNGSNELVIECRNYGVLVWDPTAGRLKEVNVPGLTNLVQPVGNPGSRGKEGYIKFADFTGDGLPELLTTQLAADNAPRWWRQTARPASAGALVPRVAYGAGETTEFRVSGPVVTGGNVLIPEVTTVLDLDGDGHQELVQVDDKNALRSYEDPPRDDISHSYRFHDTVNNVKWVKDVEDAQEPLWGSASYASSTATPLWYFADVNGDGLKDAVYLTLVGSTASFFWSVRINTGEGFLPPVAQPTGRCTPNLLAPAGSDANMLVADLNGDGRDDLIRLSGAIHLPMPNWTGYAGTRDPIQVCYSNGTGFDAPVNLPLADQAYRLFTDKDRFESTSGVQEWPAERFTMTQTGDLNGDGIAEIVDFVAGTSGGFAQGYRKPVVTLLDPAAIRGGVDLVTRVSDARGDRQLVGYDTLSAGTRARLGTVGIPSGLRDTHLRAPAPLYPAAAMTKGTVVRRFRDQAHTTPGRLSLTLHLYEGALTDLTGRGFVGFSRHYTIDQTTGDVTRYDFAQASSSGAVTNWQYPRAMRPSAMQTRVQLTATTELTLPDSTLPAATGVVTAPGMEVSEVYTGLPLRLDHVYHTASQRRRNSNGTITDTGTFDFDDLAYDAWGNVTSETNEIAETADPTFTASYTRTVTRTFDNIVDDTTWRLGEVRRVVETSRSPDPYRTAADVTDTRATELWYDAKGRLEWFVREPNTSTTAPTGTNGDLMMIRYTRNNAGLVTLTRRYLPNGLPCTSNANCRVAEECSYAASNAVGQCWNISSDASGYDRSGTFAESFTNALNQTRWVLYDSSTLLPYLVADENGVKTTITRDGLGRVRQATSDTGAGTSITYARNVQNSIPYDIVRTSEAGGGQSSLFIDEQGRPRYRSWSTFSGGSGVEDSSFDALGNVTRTRYRSSASAEGDLTVSLIEQAVAAGGSTTAQASYDRAGRQISSSRGTTETSTTSYPAYGETAVTDGEALASSTVTDSFGRVMARKLGGHEIHYRYKLGGALASITDTENHIERFYFDNLGRPVQWTTGLVGGSTVERLGTVKYDALDRIWSFQRDGKLFFQGFDLLDRLVSRGTETGGQIFVWDTGAVGRLGRAYNDDLSHDIVNRFDSFGRVSERREKFANGATSLSFGYEYDNSSGRLYRMRYPEAGTSDVSAVTHSSKGGPTVQYNYQNGQLASLTEVVSGTSGPILWRADTRHVLGMTTAATYGAPTDANRVTGTWGYNPNTLRLESEGVGNTSTTPAPAQTFSYFANGRLKTHVASGLNERYGYAGALGFLETYHRDNGAGQKLVDATYSYDDTGLKGIDVTALTGSPDWSVSTDADETMAPLAPNLDYRLHTHRVGAGPSRVHAYDAAGRVTSVTDVGGSCSATSPCASGSTCVSGTCITPRRSITWNAFNLPTEVRDSGPNVTRTFGYDAFGNRVRKTQDASNQVLYMGKLYEQRNLTALGARESVYRLYTDVGVVAELVHPWNGTSRTTRYLFTDHQGSIEYSVVNRAATQLGFFPYGKRMNTPPAQSFSQLGYTGHYQDDDLGLVNMGGRVYDLTTRRFYSRDVLPDAPLQVFGTNPYAYVNHDPVNRIDPTGFQTASRPDTNGVKCDDNSTSCNRFPDIGPAAPLPPPPASPASPLPSSPPPPAADPIVEDAGPAHAADATAPPPAMDPPTQAAMMAGIEHMGDRSVPLNIFPGDHFPGMTTYQPASQQYVNPDIANIMYLAAFDWDPRHPGNPLLIGDISLETGGPFKPHRSHREWRDIDIHAMGATAADSLKAKGPNRRGEGATAEYSRELTRDAINTILRAASDYGMRVENVFFDDRALRTKLIGPADHKPEPKDQITHDDHFHVRFEDPRLQ